ncbi:MAG: Gfo/Idh/MocA family oxidoreductase [Nitrospira sp.]|jgi:predicted dehydrogenase|nr:Gfo/Idh/MocA family oxidoreductase [Nitrospira sp.]
MMDAESQKTSAAARRPLRVGIVGAGLMGRWHAHAAKQAGGQIVAIADRNLDAATRLAGACGGRDAYADITELLRRVSCDLIHICTPLETHEQIAGIAIEAGKHVLIEKPAAPDAAGTQRLIQLAASRGVLICPVHQFVFQRGVIKARRLLGRIGRVLHLDAAFCTAGGAGRQERELDSIVAEILPHPLSLAQAFLPGGMVPDSWLRIRPQAGEFRAMTEAGGVTVSVMISLQARPTQSTVKIFGASGTIHLDLFHGYAFIEPGAVSKERKILRPFDLAVRRGVAASVNLGRRAFMREPAYPGLTGLVAELYEAARTGGRSPVSAEAMLNVARIRDLLMQGETHNGRAAVSHP